jgi:acid stress chaperone HdeB
MRPWLIMLGPGLALIGLQAVQAQVTIDITKITCNQFLAGQLTDSRTLAIWLNGYVNGARGKTLIDSLSVGENNLIDYCVSHNETDGVCRATQSALPECRTKTSFNSLTIPRARPT